MNGVTQQFTQPQRKALADMLKEWGDVWSRASKKYDGARKSLKSALVRKVAQENGADKLFVEVRQLKSKLESAEKHLSDAGFRVTSGGDFEFNYNAPDPWDESVERQLDKELGTKDEVLTRPFDAARVKLWTVATAEEAETLVEPLLNFEVRKQ